jgi:LysR family pca operon transcriptional activator
MSIDRRLKLRHIQCFLEASQHVHLSEVALRLNLTQAAISKTLTELEAILGATLLVRARAGIRLTGAGEQFLLHAQSSWGALEKGLDVVSLSNKLVSRPIELCVGMLPSVAARFMPAAVQTFLAQPHVPVSLSLSTGYNTELISRLHSGQIDLAIARIGSPADMRELEFAPLYAEPMVIVARARHPLLALPSQERMRQIARYPFLLPPPQTRIRPIVERSMVELGIPTPSTIIETVSNTFGRSFVPRSDAVWIISQGVVEDFLELESLRLLARPLENTRDPVGLMRRTDQELDSVARELSRIMLRQTQHLRDQPPTPDISLV